MKALPVADRFWSKVHKTDTCWLWTGYQSAGTGYGRIQAHRIRTSLPAHRVAYELMVGPVPAGAELDHLCGVRHCVNPHHLEAVSHHENVLRGNGIAARNARKTHCPQGHPLPPFVRGGIRRCATCRQRRTDAK